MVRHLAQGATYGLLIMQIVTLIHTRRLGTPT